MVTPRIFGSSDRAGQHTGVLGLSKDKLDGISVSLTLLQLASCLSHATMYSTSANLISKNPNVELCEVDFLLLLSGSQHKGETAVQILIGECKSEGGCIDEQDVRKLGKLATELENKIGQTYIVFSKTGAFNEEEISLIGVLGIFH